MVKEPVSEGDVDEILKYLDEELNVIKLGNEAVGLSCAVYTKGSQS